MEFATAIDLLESSDRYAVDRHQREMLDRISLEAVKSFSESEDLARVAESFRQQTFTGGPMTIVQSSMSGFEMRIPDLIKDLRPKKPRFTDLLIRRASKR